MPQAKPATKKCDKWPKNREMTPLEFMLAVMNDPNADMSRRDRMAIAAAPYMHSKAMDQPTGKQSERKQAALKAADKFDVPSPPAKSIQ
jgi:hypothetical protein